MSEFLRTLARLKRDELASMLRGLGSAGRFIVGIPGAFYALAGGIFWGIVGWLSDEAPEIGRGLVLDLWWLIKQIPKILWAIIGFLWWRIIPGAVPIVALFGGLILIVELTLAWWIEVGIVIGIIGAVWLYWNILATGLVVAGKKSGYCDDKNRTVEALARMFYGFVVETCVTAYVVFLAADLWNTLFITLMVFFVALFVVVIVTFLMD